VVKKIRTPITSTKITSGLAVYNGGPLWNTGYKWYNIYWGSYWNSPNIPFGPKEIDTATQHITTDKAYWGGLSEYATNGYDLGYGVFAGSIIISTNPPSTIDDTQIGPQIKQWISSGLIPELGQKGAYNIFFPPNVTIILEGSASCQTFCDYHNTDGTHYYTVEPYPCSSGCNQCTNNPFDALTMGLSEELVELATDMSPGTGWVIGNIELCVPPDTLLLGDNKPISEYKIGDKVIGEHGLVSVHKTFERPFNGNLIEIKASGILPFKATPNHPILVVSSINGKLTEPQWKKINEINIKHSDEDGDYLLLPKLRGNINIKEFQIDVPYKTCKPKVNKFILNNDTAWLLGIYVAEGFSETADKLHWSLNKNEIELANKIVSILEKLGCKPWITQHPTDASMVIHVSSKTLKQFFVQHCGRGATNKQIPDFILYHEDTALLRSFIEGYLAGDGCRYHNDNIYGNIYSGYSFNTVSKKLGLQLQLAGARLGYFVSLFKYHTKPYGIIRGRLVKLHEGVSGVFYNNPAKTKKRWKTIQYQGNEYFILPVTEKKEVLYNGLVYNISTDDHTYLISNVITHNCDECDQHFVCNQISTGEYVNAWYSNKYNTCWTPNWPPSSPSPPPPSTCPIAKVFTTTYNTFAKLLHRKTRLYAYVPEQCSC